MPCHGGSVAEQPLKEKELRESVCVRACVRECARECVDKEVGAAELRVPNSLDSICYSLFTPAPIW